MESLALGLRSLAGEFSTRIVAKVAITRTVSRGVISFIIGEVGWWFQVQGCVAALGTVLRPRLPASLHFVRSRVAFRDRGWIGRGSNQRERIATQAQT